jgi:DNA-directed RNA polymerase subunit RPC12/RpoP
MDQLALSGKYGPDIEVDICYACHVLWLDKRESLQLSPRGTLDVFRALHEHRDDPRHALDEGSPCPRCGQRLKLMHDIGKSGRFSYYRCPGGDGRLTPFSEFLKEKQFVRALNAAERNQLRAEIKQVQCSGCGAPVELASGFECTHCGSPLTVLDADAVAKTLQELNAADEARQAVDPADAERRARALAAMETYRTDPNEPLGLSSRTLTRSGQGTDLLAASIGLIFGGFR